jgi:hypothetical protein
LAEIVFGALLLGAIVFLPEGIVSLVRKYVTAFRETVHRPAPRGGLVYQPRDAAP